MDKIEVNTKYPDGRFYIFNYTELLNAGFTDVRNLYTNSSIQLLHNSQFLIIKYYGQDDEKNPTLCKEVATEFLAVHNRGNRNPFGGAAMENSDNESSDNEDEEPRRKRKPNLAKQVWTILKPYIRGEWPL